MPLTKKAILSRVADYQRSFVEYFTGIPKPLAKIQAFANSLPDSSDDLTSTQRRQFFALTLKVMQDLPNFFEEECNPYTERTAYIIIWLNLAIYDVPLFYSDPYLTNLRALLLLDPEILSHSYGRYLMNLAFFLEGRDKAHYAKYFEILVDTCELLIESGLNLSLIFGIISKHITSALGIDRVNIVGLPQLPADERARNIVHHNYPRILALLLDYLRSMGNFSSFNMDLFFLNLDAENIINASATDHYLADLSSFLSYLKDNECLTERSILAGIEIALDPKKLAATYEIFGILKRQSVFTKEDALRVVFFLCNSNSAEESLLKFISMYLEFLQVNDLYTEQNFKYLFIFAISSSQYGGFSRNSSVFPEYFYQKVQQAMFFLYAINDLSAGFMNSEILRKFFANLGEINYILNELGSENFTPAHISSLFSKDQHGIEAIYEAVSNFSPLLIDWDILFQRLPVIMQLQATLATRIPSFQLSGFYTNIVDICRHNVDDNAVINAVRGIYREFLESGRAGGLGGLSALYNPAQSVHIASVHKTASESAIRLDKKYGEKCNKQALELKIFSELRGFLTALDPEQVKNISALSQFENIAEHTFSSKGNFVDPASNVSTRKLLALCWLAIHDNDVRKGTLIAAKHALVNALYEIHRGYNLDLFGRDNGGMDSNICTSGAFNKLMQEMMGVISLVNIVVVTTDIASIKLHVVIFEEVLNYLNHLKEIATTDDLKNALRDKITKLKDSGIDTETWRAIEGRIYCRMMDEFASVYEGALGEAKLKAAMLEGYPYIKIELPREKFARIIKECATRYLHTLKDREGGAQMLATLLISIRSEGIVPIWDAIVASIAKKTYEIIGGLFIDGIDGEEFKAFIDTGKTVTLDEASYSRVATLMRDTTSCEAGAGVGMIAFEGVV